MRDDSLSPSAPSQSAGRVIQVGPDRVTISEQEVVIEAKHKMPDWEVRELDPAPIYFEDKKYFLVHAGHAEKPYAVRYLLQPWPQDRYSTSKLFFDYNAETVKERDAELRSSATDDVIRALLMPLYPFLGLLWSGIQNRLIRFGFVPHLITGISVFTVFTLAFAQGVFAVVMLNGSMNSGKVMIGGFIRAMMNDNYIHVASIGIPVAILDSMLLVAFIADAAMRYTHYLRDDQWAGGFLEWLLPKTAPL